MHKTMCSFVYNILVIECDQSLSLCLRSSKALPVFFKLNSIDKFITNSLSSLHARDCSNGYAPIINLNTVAILY